ncbi:AraC family transcriptional regulator [Rhizobiaceae bacterium n13]|uniref:AraC family transcriptional regulator n=1 Tax=Ferirhizobium litorale TaxID=2927786 RepID=A0AAE3QI76_9HYPH|nr:helix-turn-helix domain-containing protein [Fererhizobium litorale]MDI7862798.1 AraC family transcriptional regulator [Fererhizobium litorale]MDI7924338.1 AraC family transcriptional regulator [Fererhizobium litorale]
MGHARGAGRIDRRVLVGLGLELKAYGIDPVAIGDRIDGDHGAGAGGDPTISLSEFVGFLETAGRSAPDPAAIWRCGRAYVGAGLPELFPRFGGGARLGDVLRGVIDAMNELQSGSLFRLQVRGSLALVEYRILDPSIWPRAFDVEFTFGFFDGLIRRYFRPDFAPDSLVFEHEPDRRRLSLDGSLGLSCVYGYARNILGFPAALLSMPILGDWPAQVGGRTSRCDAPMSAGLAARLRDAILLQIGEGEINQERIAEAFGLSPRTFRRRLLQEGLCFREEMERSRMEYAREMIVRTNLPVMELALRLGYSQQSDFTRAFRRAEGVPPSELRRSRPNGVNE